MNKKENTLVFHEGTFFYNGIPCEKLPADFEIQKHKKVGEVHDYPAGNYDIYEHENRTYIDGRTISGDLKLIVCEAFYD
jgi:hypothetical protein